MSGPLRVVHYVNQFFGGIGGEDQAHVGVTVKAGAVGPGRLLEAALGDGARVGDRAQLRECIVFPGTEIAPESILIGAISGHGDILASMRRRRAQTVS